MFTPLTAILLLLLVLVIHNLFQHRVQNALLLVVSYIAYAYLDWRFLWLLILVTVVNFLLGQHISKTEKHSTRFFYLGVFLNLGVLGLFKYFNFFFESAVHFLGLLGIRGDSSLLNIALPIGISFYTFRLLSYLFDVRNNRIAAKSVKLLDFALYVAFFAQVTSGPIERAPSFLQKLTVTRRLSVQQFMDGLTYIFLGLYYKIPIADWLAPTVNGYFSRIGKLSSAEAFTAMIFFSIQLYADFAAYSL